MIYKQKWYFRVLRVSFICIFLSIITICEAKETTTNSCQNLGKVKDIDDLLFQFYSNIDSQCLFEMPTEELEKVWGIRVLDYINASSDKLNELNKEVKRIRKNEEGIFVRKVNFEQDISAFNIHLTDKYRDQNQGWGGAVGKGQFPKLLPPPQVVSDFVEPNNLVDLLNEPDIRGEWPIIPQNTVYQKYSKYYWINKSQSDKQPVLFFKTDFFPSPQGLTLYSEARILDFK